MLEKSYYSAITKYYERTATCSIAWEAKFTRTERIAFSSLAAHQEANLLKAEQVFGHKLPDSGIGQKPWDGFVLYRAKAVFIAIYYSPRATEVYEIGIRDFVNEKYTSTEKSLTKERAHSLGTRLLL